MLNMADMFGMVEKMKREMEETKARLGDITVEGEAGGGMVKVTATATHRITKIQIDPELYKDPEMMEDLICAAVNKAMEQAAETSRAELAKVTGGMMPNIPGLDLSKLGL